jgi:hypothetical protein
MLRVKSTSEITLDRRKVNTPLRILLHDEANCAITEVANAIKEHNTLAFGRKIDHTRHLHIMTAAGQEPEP